MATFTGTDPRTGKTLRPGATVEITDPKQLETIKSQNNRDTVIPADNLTQDTNIKLPKSTVPSPYNETLTRLITPEVGTSPEVQQLQQQERSVFDELISGLESTQTRGARTLKAEEEAGLQELRTGVTDIENQLRENSLSFRREREAIQARPGNAAQKQAELADVSRRQASQLADLEVIRASRTASLENIQSALDRKTALQFADEDARIKNLQFIYGQVKGDLTKEQDRAFQTRIDKENRAFQLEKSQFDELQKAKAEIIKNAASSGASSATISAIAQANDVNTLYRTSGVANFLMSPKEKLELQKLRGDIAQNAIQLNAAKSALNGTTGDPVTDIIAGSNRFGDKLMSDTTTSDLTQALVTLGNVEELQNLIAKEGTGIVTGNVKNLLGKVSGNFVNAAAINAQIQRTVPGLARGIFKEVGVLTDADIANYKKTLPNLTSPEEQNKLALLMTLDVIERSIGTTLATQAKSGRNVSGFSQDYINVKNQVNQLKNELGVPTVQITPENKAKMESSWGSPASVNESVTNTLNNLLNL